MKFKTFFSAHKSLINDVITSTCLIGASAGIVFGISAAKFKIQYMNLDGSQARLAASKNNSYVSQAIKSQWNMNEGTQDGKVIPALEAPIWADMREAINKGESGAASWWAKAHGNPTTPKYLWDKYDELGMGLAFGDKSITSEQVKSRYDYSSMVIDGSTHTTLDRSFNQSLYNGLVDFVKNERADHVDPETVHDPIGKNVANSYKPSADNTTDFISTYLSVIQKHRVVGLAGFNHSTPLVAMMTHKTKSDGTLDPIASSSSAEINTLINQAGFILLDANVANNQNIASVQFRSDQPGFLSALSTCQYFYNNLHMYHNHHQNISVAEFGGVAIPTVTIYMGGFQRGIEFFNYFVLNSILNAGAENWFKYKTIEELQQAGDDIFKKYQPVWVEFDNLVNYAVDKDEILELRDSEATPEAKFEEFNNKYRNDMFNEYSIKMIKLGDINTHFSGTFNAGDAIGITKQFLNRGASAIIAIAGPQSLDCAQEIKNQNSKCIVIGVDSSMEDGDYQRYHNGSTEKSKITQNKKDPYVDRTVSLDGSVSQQSNAIIKFSAVKDIRTVSQKITQLCAKGKNWDVTKIEDGTPIPDPDKAVCGPGFQTCGNINNGLISVSWDGFPLLINALSHIIFHYTNEDGNALELSFVDLWDKLVDKYREMLKTDDDKEEARLTEEGYWTKVKDMTELTSFNREKDGETRTLYSEYNHSIGVLGKLFDLATLTFEPNMTLVQNEETGEIVETQEPVELSIGEWLNYNMYLMC